MILDRLDAAGLPGGVPPELVPGLEYLQRGEWQTLGAGRHEIAGSRLFALIGRDPGRGRTGVRLEVHRQYIDIQYVIRGSEWIGWRALTECRPGFAFDSRRDIGFLDDPPAVWLPVPPGHFAVFYPGDAHAPLAGEGMIEKVVVKVAVEG
jgi:YhcH/YjgK/YiaL family protein